MMTGKGRVILFAALLAGLALAAPQRAWTRSIECKVRYLSSESVYLDAGAAAGLAEGDTLRVVRKGATVARLRIVFTADHSAACVLLPGGEAPRVGDAALGLRETTEAARAAPRPETESLRRRRTTAPSAVDALDGAKGIFRLGGSVSLGWDRYRGRELDQADSDRLSLRLRLDASRSGALPLRFRFRGRTQGMWRARDDWRESDVRNGRIQACALELGGGGRGLGLTLGRLSGGSGLGRTPLDGLRLEVGLPRGLRLGTFYGAMPDWEGGGLASRGGRQGLFLGAGDRERRFLLEFVSEREEGVSSRDYLALSSRWRRRDFTLRQRLTLDWNRDWRRDLSGSALSMSELVLSARYDPGGPLALRLRYDGRQSPPAVAYASLPDSLFRSVGNRGVQLSMRLRAAPRFTVRLRGGLRHRKGAERPTLYQNLSLRQGGVLGSDLDAVLRFGSFNSEAASGLDPSLDLSHPLGDRVRLGLGVGSYIYDPGEGGRRHNGWLRVNAHLRLPAANWIAVDLEHDRGDDLAGLRLHLGLGRRF